MTAPDVDGLREAVARVICPDHPTVCAYHYGEADAMLAVVRPLLDAIAVERDRAVVVANVRTAHRDRLRDEILPPLRAEVAALKAERTPVVLNLDDPFYDGQTLPEALAGYGHVHSTTGVCVKNTAGPMCNATDLTSDEGDAPDEITGLREQVAALREQIDRVKALADEDDAFGDLVGDIAAQVRGEVASAIDGTGADLVRVERCYASGIAQRVTRLVYDRLRAALGVTE